MQFQVKALQQGRIQRLVLEASSREELQLLLQQRQATPLRIQPVRRSLSRMGEQSFDSSLFTQELVALLQAGLSLVEAIEALRAKTEAGLTRQVLESIEQSLRQGQTLSQALGRHPEHFAALYLATVRASERTGHLAEALGRYNAYEGKVGALRQRVVSALVYPAVVVAIGSVVLMFLMMYVIPRFVTVFEQMRNPPTSTRLLLAWGHLVTAHGELVFGSLVLAMALVAAMFLYAPWREAGLQALFRFPRLRAIRQVFAFSRFYRTLGLLLQGGTPLMHALALTGALLPTELQAGFRRACSEVGGGLGLADALRRNGIATPISDRLLRVGEQSGELPAMAERAAQFLDEELDRAIELFSRLFEPLLMLFVGGVIGIVVFLLYMPIFEIAGSLG